MIVCRNINRIIVFRHNHTGSGSLRLILPGSSEEALHLLDAECRNRHQGRHVLCGDLRNRLRPAASRCRLAGKLCGGAVSVGTRSGSRRQGGRGLCGRVVPQLRRGIHSIGGDTCRQPEYQAAGYYADPSFPYRSPAGCLASFCRSSFFCQFLVPVSLMIFPEIVCHICHSFLSVS